MREQQPLPWLPVYRGLYLLPDPEHPIHQLANQQKRAAHDFTHELLTTLEVDDPPWSPGRWSWCWKGV
jgi:hypothetical protein